MDKEGRLIVATQSLLNEIEDILHRAADTYPYLDGPARALRRMAKAAGRPLRIGILGEANSGKSSLANLLAGVPVLPVPSMAHARVPVLLTYASKPATAAVHKNGERTIFPLLQDVAQTIAALQNSAAMSDLLAGKSVRSGGLKFLETGLPSDILRSTEILYLPAGHTVLPGYGVDAAIWTTVATRAWRESERAHWAKLPQSVRSRSLLAVTFCDLVADREINLKRLQARLETSAKPYFQGICFVENGDSGLAAATSRNRVLFAQIQYLAYQFAAERFGKAMATAHHVMAAAAARTGPATRLERRGFSSHAVAKASQDLFDGNRPITLKRPLPEVRLVKPITLCNGHASGAAAKSAARRTAQARHLWGAARTTAQAGHLRAATRRATQASHSSAAACSTVRTSHSSAAVRSTVQASHSPATGDRSRERPRWLTAAVAAAVAGTVTLAVQLGLLGAVTDPGSNPLIGASEAVNQSTVETAEARIAEAEAATAESRGKAVAEVAAGEPREAQAEAPAAEARGMAEAETASPKEPVKTGPGREAQAEVAAPPKSWKKAEAGRRSRIKPEEAGKSRRTVAQAVLRPFNGNGPIMHGVSQ